MLMDAIDKYYLIAELLGDDLNRVVGAIKANGVKARPSRIMKNLEDLFVHKYEKHFDKILIKIGGRDGANSETRKLLP